MKTFKPSPLLIVLAFCLFSSIAALAQVPPGGGPQPGGGTGPDPTPIDGGASLLLASGVAYGLRRLRQRKNTGRA